MSSALTQLSDPGRLRRPESENCSFSRGHNSDQVFTLQEQAFVTEKVLGVGHVVVLNPPPLPEPRTGFLLAIHHGSLVGFLKVKQNVAGGSRRGRGLHETVTRTVRPVHAQPQVNSSQLPWKCSYQFMAPAASGAGTQLSAKTPWIFLSPDVAVVCPVTSVHWWVSPREVIDFVCSTFCSYKGRSDDFPSSLHVHELKLEACSLVLLFLHEK